MIQPEIEQPWSQGDLVQVLWEDEWVPATVAEVFKSGPKVVFEDGSVMLIRHRDAAECMRRVGHLVKRNIEENADEPRDSDEAVVDSTTEEKLKGMDNLVDEKRDTATRENDEHAACLGQPLNIPSEGQAKAMMGHSSMFRGVCWYKRDQKWQAQIRIDEKETHLGRFDNQVKAASICPLFHIARR